MKVIKVPKTPMSAYNPGRPASDLLKAQLAHLEAASGIPPGDRRSRRALRSEGQVASYIGQLTRALHPQGNDDPAVRLEPPTVDASVTRRGAARSKRSTASSTRARRARAKKATSTRARSVRTPVRASSRRKVR